MTSLKLTLTILCATLLFYSSAFAQDNVPSYETTDGSVGTASPDNTGPETTFGYELELNADNPTASTFSAASSPVTVTYTISNQPYDVSQDTDQSGGAGTTNDPASVFGWRFTDPNGSSTLIYNGSARDILQLLSAFPTQSIPASNNFTSLKSVAYLSTSPDGDGIDVSGTGNYGANISISYEGLSGSFDTRADVGTLTVHFSKPVDDPVLHFSGLGGRWFVTIDPGGGNPITRYYNTATTDFDFEAASSTAGIGTPVVLSGTSNFAVTDVSGTDVIQNTSSDPDANADNSIGGVITFAVAHGSVLFPGEDIQDIVFTMRARFMTTRDLLDGTSGTDGSGNPYDQTVFGDTDGLGWAGGGTDTNNSTNNAIPSLNFSSDVFTVSASIPAPNDRDLTGTECFRMITSPVQSTTYATLLDPVWTQGVTGADYTGGSPNVWLWPNTINNAGTDATGWSASGLDLTNTIPAGSGFLLSVFADDNFDGTGDPFPKTLSVEGGENDPPISPTMNSTSDGFTLLGNPFKTTIAWDNLTTSNVVDAVYVYDKDNGGGAYRSYASGAGDLTGGLIAPFQGFFVQNSGSGSVTFTDAAKSTSSGTFYTKEQELQNFARFEVNGEGLNNSMWIRFSNEGSMERTNGDALELSPLTYEYAMLGTRKEDDTIFDIGHYPIPNEEMEIPVSLETTRPGSYTITATDMNLSFGSDLYLIDLQEEESVRIDENFSYQFTVSGTQAAKTDPDMLHRCPVPSMEKAKTVASTDRFVLATQPKDFSEIPTTLALNQNYPNPFNPTTQITYDLPQQSKVRLEVYDLVGRQVATLVNQTMEAGEHTVNFNASNLSSGVYIYRLNTGSKILSRKLTVIK